MGNSWGNRMGQHGEKELRADLITLPNAWKKAVVRLGQLLLPGNSDRTAKLAKLLKSSVSDKACTTENMLQYSAPQDDFYRIHAWRSISTSLIFEITKATRKLLVSFASCLHRGSWQPWCSAVFVPVRPTTSSALNLHTQTLEAFAQDWQWELAVQPTSRRNTQTQINFRL